MEPTAFAVEMQPGRAQEWNLFMQITRTQEPSPWLALPNLTSCSDFDSDSDSNSDSESESDTLLSIWKFARLSGGQLAARDRDSETGDWRRLGRGRKEIERKAGSQQLANRP